MKTYDDLVARAATVGIIPSDESSPKMRPIFYRNGKVVYDGAVPWSFLRGVSAALDAVEAMQAERKPAGEMPKGGAA